MEDFEAQPIATGSDANVSCKRTQQQLDVAIKLLLFLCVVGLLILAFFVLITRLADQGTALEQLRVEFDRLQQLPSLTTATTSETRFHSTGAYPAKQFPGCSCNVLVSGAMGGVGPPGPAGQPGPIPTGSILQYGNSFKGPIVIGSNDSHPVYIKTSNSTRVSILDNGNVQLSGNRSLILMNADSTAGVHLKAAATTTSSWTFQLPPSPPSTHRLVLTANPDGSSAWSSGPSSITYLSTSTTLNPDSYVVVVTQNVAQTLPKASTAPGKVFIVVSRTNKNFQVNAATGDYVDTQGTSSTNVPAGSIAIFVSLGTLNGWAKAGW